jgi:hypothetical protein
MIPASASDSVRSNAGRILPEARTGNRAGLLLCAALVLLACRVPATAALVWPKTSVEIVVPAGASETVVFPFRNAGPAPVRIAMVLSSCDCVTAQSRETPYASGEAGEIRAVFKAGERTGRMERTISVVTDDAPESPVTLVLRIQVNPAAASH